MDILKGLAFVCFWFTLAGVVFLILHHIWFKIFCWLDDRRFRKYSERRGR